MLTKAPLNKYDEEYRMHTAEDAKEEAAQAEARAAARLAEQHKRKELKALNAELNAPLISIFNADTALITQKEALLQLETDIARIKTQIDGYHSEQEILDAKFVGLKRDDEIKAALAALNKVIADCKTAEEKLASFMADKALLEEELNDTKVKFKPKFNWFGTR